MPISGGRGRRVTSQVVDNPLFARVWTTLSAHEPESLKALRRENLAGLSGRVLEVGAGTGTNFAFYPDAVDEVVAIEPEARLAAKARVAAADAPVPVTLTDETVEAMDDTGPFDAVVCSLVLCSVEDPDGVLRQLNSRLRPGGELRYLEHVASRGLRGRLQRFIDRTAFPRLMGNCHAHRDTERSITRAGFDVDRARHDWTVPAWLPVPTSEVAIGRAVKPAAP
jgi:SAM-dependent methyltransferase